MFGLLKEKKRVFMFSFSLLNNTRNRKGKVRYKKVREKQAHPT